MNFYISKIKLWFNKENESRTFEFYNDKVNIITGYSSTGKSSLLKIIDYCLLNDRCTIVQDIINENVSWYGLVFHINDTTHTIIRRAPKVEQADMCVIFKDEEFLPDSPCPDLYDLRSNAMIRMNELFNINSKLKLDSKIKYNFRHNLLFNYLTEDIISTENTYQDLRFFRSNDFVKILDDLFKMAIGVNEYRIRELHSNLEDAKGKLRRKQSKQKQEIEDEEKYYSNREMALSELIELGLCDSTDHSISTDEWIKILKNAISAYDIQFRDTNSNDRRLKLEQQLINLKEDYGYYRSLQKEYESYMKRLGKQDSCLVPLDYMKKHMPEVFRYQETNMLLSKLSEAWLNIKKSYNPNKEIPVNFQNRMKELKEKIDEVTVEYKSLNPLQPHLQDVKWIRSVILLLESIEKQLMKAPVLKISDAEIIKLEENITGIEDNLVKIGALNNNAIIKLNECINKYFTSQHGVSESYMDCKAIYSIEEHALMLERAGIEYPIANVGSKSNYMFLHLCYFFGLHELLVKNMNRHIPQFLFIDQPSIPYYADKNDGANIDTLNDDESKLRAAFKLIDKFMKEITKENHFQIIMIEHAGPNYWEGDNKLETFETRYQFTQGNGLVPNNIIHK